MEHRKQLSSVKTDTETGERENKALLLTVIVLESVVIFHKMCYILLLIRNGLATVTLFIFNMDPSILKNLPMVLASNPLQRPWKW